MSTKLTMLLRVYSSHIVNYKNRNNKTCFLTVVIASLEHQIIFYAANCLGKLDLLRLCHV